MMIQEPMKSLLTPAQPMDDSGDLICADSPFPVQRSTIRVKMSPIRGH